MRPRSGACKGASPIVGAWRQGDWTTANNSGVVVFLPNGVYFEATDTSTAEPGYLDGIEHGTYAWNPTTGVLTSSRTPPPYVDTDGRSGLSDADGSGFTFTFSVSADGLTLTGTIGTDSFTLARVGSVPPAPTTAEVVEYFNASLDHYFITWIAGEIALLDAGTTIKGWLRTGKTFKTYPVAHAGTTPVCRYYIPPGKGDSHFFGRGTVECDATGQKNPSFVLEDPQFMQMFLPNAGNCPASTVPIYRVFSNRPDANHRYMMDKARARPDGGDGLASGRRRAGSRRHVRAGVSAIRLAHHCCCDCSTGRSTMGDAEALARFRGGSGDRRRRALAAFALLACSTADASLGTAVEFHNAGNNHYFITAYPDEAAALDVGTTVKGWKRTGGQFTVFTEPADGLQAVCRFFGTPGRGPDSHFYTADAAECAHVKTLPAWTFESIAFYIPSAAAGDCGGNWPVYRSYYSDNVSDANHRFTVDLTAHARMPQRRGDVLEGVVMCAPVTDEEREADVVRFLEQATLGPTEALVAEVKAKGIAAWLDEQIPMNVTRYTQYPLWDPPADQTLCIDDRTAPPYTPEKFCRLLNYSPTPVSWDFFRQSRSAPDQLRLRMAHVWHQIFVLGDQGIAYVNADFQQRLRDHALGTFENLLTRYTLSPQLGAFQNWIRNVPEHDGIRPNENFARELMQLFTIGVNTLNDDGTPKLTAGGQLQASYAQSDIETLARILTGYTYPKRPGENPDFWNGGMYFFGDMIAFDQWHDKGAKSALGGRIQFPPGGGAQAEVAGALHALVQHPNTAPFIAKQLIQKTVTSSPSPGYVGRVAAAFRNNGKGVRGDLAAVTRAVLVDPEARGARKIDAEYGRMREPVLFWTAMIRALDVATDGFQPDQQVRISSQTLFAPPTVFNYYPADFTLAGSDIPAPEFGIYTSAEFLNRANQVNDLLYNVDQSWTTSPLHGWGPLGYVPNAVGTRSPALSAFLGDAANPDVLVERLNRLFLHGTMTPAARKTIVNAVGKLDPGNPLRRVKLAVNLVLVSLDYQVQK